MATKQAIIFSPRAKQRLIKDHLRQLIVRGELPPGSRIPTHVELVQRFQVAGVTVQRALEGLARDGFIEPKGRAGTFVSENPPHLGQYALVFGERGPGLEAEYSRFYKVLETEVLRLQRQQQRIRVYHDVTGRTNDEGYQRLWNDVQEHRVAGLILVSATTLGGTPLLTEPGICRAAIVSHVIGPSIPTVYPDINQMVDRALDAFIKKGRRRIAVIITPQMYDHVGQHLATAVMARGITLPQQWLQIVPAGPPEATRNSVLLLMMLQPSDRPEGLLILDDSLAESASAGLVAAGIKVPDDVMVVTHCNFPWQAPSVLAVERLGFATQSLLLTAIELINAQRRGERVPLQTLLAPVFESEYVSGTQAAL